MRRTIRLSENKLHSLISETVKRILREYQFDNDIDYNSIYEQALDLLSGGGEPSGYSWRDVAEAMGFRLDSLGQNDMETMKDAIEDAMMDTSGLANESKLRGFVRETVKRILHEHYMDYPRNDEQLASTIDDAKRFLRDYGSYYENYPGPYISITNGDSIEGLARHANYMYNALKYQNCQDKELMGAMKSFLDYLYSK